MMLRQTPQMLKLKKIKNRRKQNFEDATNNMHLRKENTQRGNFDSKYPFRNS